jgi:hypothetical protein
MSDIVDRLLLIAASGDSGPWERHLEEAAEEIARLRDESRWIPVAERLPDEGVSVLVWHKGGNMPDIGWREYRQYYIVPETIWTLGDDLDKGYPPENITHWMPLPAGPAE